MTFNDFQKHIQNLNYVNQVSQQCQASSTRSNQEERSGYMQYNQPLSNQSKQNIQHFSQNQIDQKQGKSFNNSYLQEEQKVFSNTQNNIQQRSQKNCPLPPSQTSIQQDQSNKKKNTQSQSISNLVRNNLLLKNSAQSEQQIEQSNYNYSKNTNLVNNQQQQINSQSASYLSNKQYTNQQEQQRYQQQQVSNRWLFTNQNQANNQNQNNEKNQQPVSNNIDLQNFQTNTMLGCKLASNQQSFQNTPRDKIQLPQQNQKNSYLDFESSQQQTSKNQASQYMTKNTQFIKNKEPQTFQSILQQQQNHTQNSQSNQQSFQNGVQLNNFPQTNELDLAAETPKQKFFTKIQYDNNNYNKNNKSTDNISTNSLLKRNSDKKNNLRNVTPPDSTIRYKISNQNNLETPQCNFSSLIMKNDQSHQQLPRKNLNNQLKLESIDQENYYSYNQQAERQVQNKMTPNQYESRIQELKQLVNDSENILNTSESKIQINEESTPLNNKQKFRYKLEEFQQENNKNYDFNKNNNNKLNNGTENSLSVEEHIDDSILDEKISRSMFKANPSQHIQQKVQYECISIKCQNCQYEQQLQLKKILENIKQSLNSNVFMNNFTRDNSYRNENQIREVKEQLSPETTLNSINENSQDPNKTIRQLNCLASATYLDLSKKSHENQRSSSSTCNLNSNKLKQNNQLKQNNDHELNTKIEKINEQLKLEVKNLTQKEFELEFQQQKMDDMNTQIKTLTLKLQEIQEQKTD
ncbi:hypothetical protein TTHERM_00295130 (macronuclear) [Tetrahymena thermophila SB210]|uniref:Uncharacterized protein n=1 Tax=Tetrahymena thermophila (strain SB210) TaxID=312017 RepID=I7MIC9_TETTS|nr:hypothetical protein TTHERM_00295130 [Tetrahymena thermophila SB210]EAR92900.3 hypothetical protein TTHERM_00295130 [Tetrahymena thermophila SB210]|eukprot:XP_001013145.3 hypothetical protein TTHERM_00295130 [Tetrahymena thermophila SB210]